MLTLPVVTPSIVLTVIIISLDDGLVRFNKNITNPWSSLTCIDDSLKYMSVSAILRKGNTYMYVHT